MLLSLWEEAITYSYLENINQQIQVSHCQRTIQVTGNIVLFATRCYYVKTFVPIAKHRT